MKQLAYISLGWLLTVLVSWCMGKLVFRRLSIRLYRQEEDVMAFMLGSACLSTLVFLICAMHLAYKPVFLAIALAAIAAGIQQRIWRTGGEVLPRLSWPWFLLFFAIWGSLGAALGGSAGSLHLFASAAVSDFELRPAPENAHGWCGGWRADFHRSHCGYNRHECV